MSFTIACESIPHHSQIISIIIFSFILLIPITIVEAILLKIFLKKKWSESFIFCSIANIASTIAGMILFFIINLFNLSKISTINLIFLTIFLAWFIAPVLVENIIYKRLWKDIPKRKLLEAVIAVNLVTSVILSLIAFYQHKVFIGAREKVSRISCTSNLKQIGLSLKQYAMDYNDYLPNKPGVEGFEQLRTTDYLTNHIIYICPETDHFPGREGQKLTDEIVDYIYKNGLKDSDNSEIPLAWDKPENHENYGNVLFLDGHVKGFKGANWMEQAGIIEAEK